MDTSHEEQQIDLRDYAKVLLKRRWTIISVFTIIFVSVFFHTFTTIPVYKASSRIVIEKENPNLMSIQEVMSVDATGSDYYQTQYKIIESRAVIREVIDRLSLADSPEFTDQAPSGLLGPAKEWVSGYVTVAKEWVEELLKPTGAKEPPVGDEEADSGLVTAVAERISIEPIRNSRLVDVSIEAKNPALAAKMANELVRAYIDQNLETKLRAAKDAVQWLGERIDEERKKVEEAEQKLLRYKENNDIITDFSSESEQITAQKLAQLNQQVVESQAQRVEAETRYKQAMAVEGSPDLLDSIPEVLNNELIREIKKMEVQLYSRMSELSKKYGQKHPQMVALDSELADLQKRKKSEVNRVINSLRNNYLIAQAREESLKKALAQQKSESLEMNQKAIQFGVLRRQAESARNMYELLVKRFKETSLTEEMKTGNIRIIDSAEVPQAPSKPKKKLNLLLGMVVGLALGIGLAFFIEFLDNTVKIPEDVKRWLGIPYLGLVPFYKTNGKPGGISRDLITMNEPKSNASESFRGIRTGILYSSPDHPPRIILVTSAGPGEGKTSCATNLAVTMAQSGSKVLMIDCDLRRPRLHKCFKMRREPGLSNVLIGEERLNDVIVPTGVENLSAIPCGPIPPNPSEIVSSKKMAQVLEALSKGYDRIIIDSPPITAVTDSVILSQMVDGTLLVIRAGETPRPVIANGVEALKSVQANILGAVLNAVDMGRDGYYYYNYYYYYYGDPDQKAKKSRRKKQRKDSERENAANAA